MDEQYFVSFGDEQQVLSGVNLIKFIEVAVVKNKDISAMTIQRIEDIYVDDYGKPSYILANN